MSYLYQQIMPAISVEVAMLYVGATNVYVGLLQRTEDPYKDCWELPGEFMLATERISQTATRVVETYNQIDSTPRFVCYLDNIYRDSRCRLVSFIMFIQVKDKPENDAESTLQWFNIKALPAMAFDHELAIKEAYDLMKKIKTYEHTRSK